MNESRAGRRRPHRADTHAQLRRPHSSFDGCCSQYEPAHVYNAHPTPLCLYLSGDFFEVSYLAM